MKCLSYAKKFQALGIYQWAKHKISRYWGAYILVNREGSQYIKKINKNIVQQMVIIIVRRTGSTEEELQF